MALRWNRIVPAMLTIESVSAGRMRCRRMSTEVASSPPAPSGSRIPAGGSNRQRTPTNPASTSPSQKEGVPYPEPESERKVQQQDCPAEQQGRRQALEQEARHRPTVLDRDAEVPAAQTGEEGEELPGERTVESVP